MSRMKRYYRMQDPEVKPVRAEDLLDDTDAFDVALADFVIEHLTVPPFPDLRGQSPLVDWAARLHPAEGCTGEHRVRSGT